MEEEKEAQEAKEKRVLCKKWRQRVRQIHSQVSKNGVFVPDSIHMQEMTSQYDVHQLQDICADIYSLSQMKTSVSDDMGLPSRDDIPEDDSTQEAIRRIFVDSWLAYSENKRRKEEQLEMEMLRKQRERDERDQAKKLARESSWSPDELSLLAKGLQKFPGGTPRRWQLISDMIGTKTNEEVLEQAKVMAEGSSLKAMGSKINSVAFSQFKAHNQGAFKKVQVDPDKRDMGDMGEKAKQEGVDASEGSQQWTKEEQLHLETALAKHPSTIPSSERWSLIANDVPGKSKKDCIERFKQIRAAVLASKKK